MRSKLVVIGLGALALAATATPAFAQKPSLGIAAGVSMPQGDFKDIAGSGLNATVALGLGMPMLPVGLRIEGSYNRFPFAGAAKDAADLLDEKGNWNFASATGNVTVGLPLSAVVVSPYVIAGAGMYWGNCSIKEACDAESKFGYNGGLGVKLRAVLLSGYIEARYHSIQTEESSTNFVPITIGIMF
jgi:hypothetical protein